ncbi:MAG: T9SS type A sorting domain-containing protein [Tenuifilaceae bacterium]
MPKIRLIVVFLLMGTSTVSFSQYLRNEGRLVLASGGQINVQGNIQNEGTGEINSSGIITLTGNLTNNGSSNIFTTPLNTNNEVVFAGTSQIIGGTANLFDFQKITINSGSTTQVEAGKGVTANGACTFTTPLNLKSSTTAFRPIIATFINNSTVTGDISMELSYTSTGTSASGAGRGLYFSSPISNATSTIFDVASGSNLIWYQNEILRQYVKISTNGTPLTVAKGYILRAPTSQVFSFTGTPNTASSYSNSNIPRAVTGQFYLMGNPYPAVIDWQTIATKTNLSGTIWYQTSSTLGTPMVVDTWNGVSQTGTANNGTASVDGKIPPMQSFWVQCTDVGLTGAINIEDNDRTHNWGNSKFLKSKSTSIDKNLLRLYLYTNDKRDEAIILQSESAQENFDTWDSRKMLLKDGVRAEIYTLSPERTNLVIQSIKPIAVGKKVHLGISVGAAGEYKFVANLSESSNSNNIFLEDKQLSVIQDLIANPEYIFTSGVVDDTSRFVIHYKAAPTVIANNPLAVCAPGKVDLTDPSVTAGSESGLVFTYWLDNAAILSYPTPNEAVAGNYYIKGTAANGTYKIVGPIVVTVVPKPIVVANAPIPVCSPNTIDLTSQLITNGSSDGLSFSYWTDKDATISYNTPTSATNGTYFIKGTTDNGCYNISEPIDVIINLTPSVVVNLPAPACSPNTIDLTSQLITEGSTEGLSFSYWNDRDATISYNSPTSATNGTFFIKGTTANGCYNISEPIEVTINETPSVMLSSIAPVCSPETIDLTSQIITNGSTADLIFTYWTDSNATVSYNSPSAASSGTYYVKGTSSNGCFSIVGPLDVTINPVPVVVTTNPAPVISPATIDLTSPTITAGSSPGLLYTYWIDEFASSPYPTPQTAGEGNYFIKGTFESTGCYTIAGPVTVLINSNTTDISSDNTKDIKIYSTNNQVHIVNCKPNSSIYIYDILGNQKYFGISKSEKEVITCNYISGIYIVKVTSNQNVKSKKVFIE